MLVSVAEAAELSGISRRTINYAINEGQLPAERLGVGAWMIQVDDLNKWIAERPSIV